MGDFSLLGDFSAPVRHDRLIETHVLLYWSLIVIFVVSFYTCGDQFQFLRIFQGPFVAGPQTSTHTRPPRQVARFLYLFSFLCLG